MDLGTLSSLWEGIAQFTPLPVKQYYWAASEYFTNPWFWLPFAVILVAQRLWPVVPRHAVANSALVEDSIWLNIELATRAAVLPLTAGLLTIAWTRTTGGFSVPVLAGLSAPARIGISLVVWDFLEYAHHWLRHRSTTLWHFHAIHHSQRHLNLFTTSRRHVLEYVITQPFQIIPLLALQLTPFEVMGTGFAIGWYARLGHANIRTNFGPLGLLFVSPQNHRIHHSIEPEHRDKNIGVLLTIWDRMFGTYWPDRTVYPATGVDDVTFDLPEKAGPVSLARAIGSQLAYPFRKIAQSFGSPPS